MLHNQIQYAFITYDALKKRKVYLGYYPILLIFKFSLKSGKELQKVLEKLDIKNVMEAVGTEDAEGIDNLWKVSWN